MSLLRQAGGLSDEKPVWVPGRVWGPAWVSFRYGESDVGWAPLPPEGYDDVPSYGYEPTINVAFWNFVPRQHFNDRDVRRYYGDYLLEWLRHPAIRLQDHRSLVGP